MIVSNTGNRVDFYFSVTSVRFTNHIAAVFCHMFNLKASTWPYLFLNCQQAHCFSRFSNRILLLRSYAGILNRKWNFHLHSFRPSLLLHSLTFLPRYCKRKPLTGEIHLCNARINSYMYIKFGSARELG